MTAKIAAAREEGDLRENGGYHAAREEQGQQEARIRQLADMLRRAQVGEAPVTSDEVAPGTKVTIAFDGDESDTDTFVLGSRELLGLDADATNVYSPQSPLGAAILGSARRRGVVRGPERPVDQRHGGQGRAVRWLSRRRALKHGYTNATTTDGRTVVKRYLGPDAEHPPAQRGHGADRAWPGSLPVPPIVAEADGEITLGLVAGRPGQELLEEQPEQVLYAVGRLARGSRRWSCRRSPPWTPPPTGTVLVHGDFGPQNLLLDPTTVEPTALVDWEFAHIGDPVEDLAWAEWIVRTHHPQLVPALPALFDGYGSEPPWPVRHESMLEKCRWLLGFARRWPDPTARPAWSSGSDRLAATGPPRSHPLTLSSHPRGGNLSMHRFRPGHTMHLARRREPMHDRFGATLRLAARPALAVSAIPTCKRYRC